MLKKLMWCKTKNPFYDMCTQQEKHAYRNMKLKKVCKNVNSENLGVSGSFCFSFVSSYIPQVHYNELVYYFYK